MHDKRPNDAGEEASAGGGIATLNVKEQIDQFLRTSAEAFASLRYVALAGLPRSLPDSTDSIVNTEGFHLRREDHTGNDPSWRRWKVTQDRAPWRWWKITRGHSGTKADIIELSAEEGERVRAYLREADEGAIARFNGKLSYVRRMATWH